MTDVPTGVGNYRIEAIVADIPRLLVALGIAGPVHEMGDDWGALIAWCLALAHPGRVRDLVAHRASICRRDRVVGVCVLST